eukprot:NODE_975_length_534_cov_236.447174_g965_i0.p1 GENE.NODE_975_length_534_cov_236.447174_g965_i0~~NODE_975_length_534_cov_236.447174_g965_i0.p1  ORF type:complete len:176 (-),score=39.53 NODE_975_length_534_cov_236.447174_g965_i0:5-532(-)
MGMNAEFFFFFFFFFFLDMVTDGRQYGVDCRWQVAHGNLGKSWEMYKVGNFGIPVIKTVDSIKSGATRYIKPRIQYHSGGVDEMASAGRSCLQAGSTFREFLGKIHTFGNFEIEPVNRHMLTGYPMHSRQDASHSLADGNSQMAGVGWKSVGKYWEMYKFGNFGAITPCTPCTLR